ncbi:ABC transporter-like protein [Dothistroma septosporum NZE10]|uniref:ABC transporter-like protein n=1 Tax=Dothistroma septosporum (strain NZE10 / CBS 128990) TaxID=675120 RepID=N1PZX4_DOTSN|nr:ABC transporter-like protein [Dothistroma septosporum NZE10]
MWRSVRAASLLALLSLPWDAIAGHQIHQYYTANDDLLLQRNPFSIYEKRPEDCPPCFNCNLDDFKCMQYGNCTKSSGKCTCPPGFGGEDCSLPLCGSLADGKDRMPRNGDASCQCDDGWEGINCNVCKTNQACNAMMPNGEDGVCYREGVVQKENFQICDITNRKILDMLKDQKPQATFSCNAERAECNFQFWVDQKESFYCALDTCNWDMKATDNRNTTTYRCENLKCSCVPDRMLCGAPNSIDLGDFLDQEIKGPAEFTSVSTDGGSDQDGSTFSEPAMNGLISSVFGDKSIFLKCNSGECLYKTEVPGYERPIKTINTPLIAGVISGCALFVVAVVLLVFFMSRRGSALGHRYGLIHLSDDEEEENARLLADHKPATLHFENVCYNLKGRQILTNIMGSVRPGELLAIMGASGAGKTSFLDILARKKKSGLVTGEFWLNGEKVSDDDFRSVIGFVDQEDTMLPTLTVHETILDSALLRLPKTMSRAAKEQKVEDVERQLGIYNIRHQIVGSEETGRGISGGEKRRVGIACELVTSPSILFLDEPTSGLDAYNAFNVVESLVTLVKSYNRTVVFTIHQPRSNIVALFDQLLLLAQGRIVYSGPFRECQEYFDAVGYSCPPGFNIADYLVDLTMHATADIDSEDFDDTNFSAEFDGRTTRASSTMAVKSIPSVSNVSIDESLVSGQTESLLRPKGKRKTSIRQQQERQLFSRKSTEQQQQPPSSNHSASDGGFGDSESTRQQWLKLSKQLGAPPPQILDDPHNLPPATPGATGTNLDLLVTAYVQSQVASNLRSDIKSTISDANSSNEHAGGDANGNANGRLKGYSKPWIHTQFLILSRRTWRNLYRNPMLMLTHYAIAIVLAVFTGFLFYGLTDDLKGFQNRLGFFFFLLALFGFSTLTSLTVFAPERLLFLRERAKGYYHPLAYYLSKVVFDIVPLRLIPPLIMGCIVYPMTGLIPAWGEFFKFILFIVLFNLAAAMICLFIGIVVRNAGVANLLGVLVMLFSLLFGGFLLNHETIPKPLLWLQSLSIFHFGFEGLIVNEVRYLSLIDKKYGLDIEVPGSAILSSFGFNVLALWNDVVGLAVFCGVFLLLGYGAIHVFLVEQR